MKNTLRVTVARIALCGAAVASTMFALSMQGAQAETLMEALARTYTSNPSLQSARATLRATDENLSQALSGYRPSVSVSGSSAYNNQETSSTRAYKTTHPNTLALNLNQSLYAGGRTQASVLSAKNTIKAQRARLMGTEQSVLLAAATAYLDVLRDQAVLELNVKNEEVLRRHLAATRDRFKVGEITRTDVHQAEARLAGATAARIQAQGTLDTVRATYANVVGNAPGTLKPLSIALPLPASLGEALSAAEDGNPTIKAAIFTQKASRDAVAGARGKLLPSLDLSAGVSRSLHTLSRGYWSNALEAKLTLSVPLYQAGAVYSQVRQARQKETAARLDADQARRDVTEQVRRSWQNFKVAQARIESIKIQVRAAQTALEGVEREASVGSRTILDVLDAEQEFLDARVNLVKSQRDEVVSEMTVLSSVGRLTAAVLNLKVDLYDTHRHYREIQGKWFGDAVGG